MAKTKLFAASALAVVSLGAFAPTASALVSSTDAPVNDTTGAIARLQIIDKQEIEKSQQDGTGKVTATVCTGTLVAPQWILTAGHCDKNGIENSEARATFGTQAPKAALSADSHKIIEAKVHSDNDDMALFKLEKPVENITPLKMWDSVVQKDTDGKAYGWGREKGSDPLTTLNTLDGTMSHRMTYGKPFPAMDTNPVTYQGGHSATGDSGSPFIIDGAVHGVLSMGTVPSEGEVSQGLYMPTAQYKDWIAQTIGQDGSFTSPSGAQPGKTDAPSAQDPVVEAEVPAKDPSGSDDKGTVAELPTTSTQDPGKDSTDKRDTNKTIVDDDGYIEDEFPLTPGTVIPQAENTTDQNINQDNQPVQTTSNKEANQAKPVSAPKVATPGPKVNTGGDVEGASFFTKVKSLF